MPKVLLLTLGLIFTISTSTYGQEQFTVSGEIRFHEEKGQFFVWLNTHEEFEIRSEPTMPSRILTIKPNPQQLKAKKITFKFINVPAGNYCIYCLHDLNKNGKMDRVPETALPAEPNGFSGPLVYGKAMWQDVSFTVDKNINGIEIKF